MKVISSIFNLFIASLSVISITLVTGFACIYAISLSLFTRRHFEPLVQVWSSALLFLARIKVHKIENNPLPDEGVLFLFNHMSLLDIPVFFKAIGCPVRFGAKKELFKIPIFGFCLRRFGFLEIDRSNKSKVFKIYKETAQRLSKGECFVLAPEGTRQHKAHIGEFKSGPFIFAINSKAKVVPVVLEGLNYVVPKHHILPQLQKQNHVQISILPAIDTTAYNFESRMELKQKTRNSMLQAFKDLQEKRKTQTFRS